MKECSFLINLVYESHIPKFNEKIERLENILDMLQSGNCPDSEVKKLLQEAEKLKNECTNDLAEEREQIIKVAEENNIDLKDLDI